MSRRLIALLLVILFTGCSSSTPDQIAVKQDSAVTAERDACNFLTLGDVQEIYGPTMKKSEGVNLGVTGPSNDVATCTYQGGDPLVLATMMATWSKMENPTSSRDAYAKSAEAFVAGEKDVSGDLKEAMKVEKIDFQGLPALWQAGQLKVFKNGVMLSILADAAKGKTAKETMELFMTKAAGRL